MYFVMHLDGSNRLSIFYALKFDISVAKLVEAFSNTFQGIFFISIIFPNHPYISKDFSSLCEPRYTGLTPQF